MGRKLIRHGQKNKETGKVIDHLTILLITAISAFGTTQKGRGLLVGVYTWCFHMIQNNRSNKSKNSKNNNNKSGRAGAAVPKPASPTSSALPNRLSTSAR